MTIERIEALQSLLQVSRGERPADVVLTGCQIVNVFSGEIERGSIAIADGKIAGIGDYSGREEISLNGGYVAPGLIDGHIHIESTKLTPPRFAEAALLHGTTAVVADPHEIANVWGLEGIRYMLRRSHSLPVDFHYMLPSCVPATSMETAGAALSAADLQLLLGDEMILGVGEVMNFPGAVGGANDVLQKVMLGGETRPVDGHAPGLTGRALNAYLASGPSTDHECTTIDEAREKLRLGMRVLIREGSTARNLQSLCLLITPSTERRCLLVSDDRRAGDLVADGHLDAILRRAVALGVDPVVAIRMVTLNPAEAYLLRDRGGIRPGWRADLVVFDDLEKFRVRHLWKDGRRLICEGQAVSDSVHSDDLCPMRLNVPPLSEDDFRVVDHNAQVRVIHIVKDEIVTGHSTESLPASMGELHADPTRDIVKLAVVERHTGSGRSSVGFVKGLGLKHGAIGSTVAHDSHNIILTGVDDRSLLTAANVLIRIGGGQVVVDGDRVVEVLPLPIAGLMSELPAAELARVEDRLIEAAHHLGAMPDDPFMALSFLALPVIPTLKLTDYGLVDVNQFKHVPLYV